MSAGTLITPVVARWIQDGLRIRKASGSARRASCPGSGAGTASSSGLPDVPLVHRRARPTSPTTRSIVTSRAAAAATPRSSTSTSGASGRSTPTRSCSTRSRRLAAALRGCGIGKGDRLTIYMPTCAEVDRADARDGAHRRDSLGGLRRVRREGARRSHPGERLAAGLHGRRHLPQGQGRPAEGNRRRGARADRRPRGPSSTSIVLAADVAGRVLDARVQRRDDPIAGTTSSRAAQGTTATSCAWRRTSRRTSSRPPARPPSRSWRSTPTAATRCTSSSMGRWCFGLKPDDVWWATSDIGWIVGHSYMVYAPLITGCTTVVVRGRARPSRARTPTGAWSSRSSA